MKFLDRTDETSRLDRLLAREEGGLAVMVGRRRIGKTRILVEWARRRGGLYTVADESAPEVQRRYLAEAIASRFPAFGDVEYRDYATLFARLSREAESAGWRGPLILDELPYLVAASPELPSVLQRWIDHEARAARLVVAVAGSSQRMMQGLVLSASAPLFGRAVEILDVGPLDPAFLPAALGCAVGAGLVEAYAAWGGIPRYWELAAGVDGDTAARIERLVLDPLGPLHREPERLLLEEAPSAMEVRPVLDAIGAGVHRVSEIGGRLGRPATSLSRPLHRLVEMGMARRETPFGESERQTRRALYRIDDPFLRLWFRVVAPHRALLTSGTRAGRFALLGRHWPGLLGEAWEDLCRRRVPTADAASALHRGGPWGPAARWWRGASPEWDLVSESTDGGRLLLGEAKWGARPFDGPSLERALRAVRARPAPSLPDRGEGRETVRALFVPEVGRGVRRPKDIIVATVADLVT